MNRGKHFWVRWTLVVATLLFLIAPVAGCDEEGAMDEFRRVSAEGLSAGLQSMFAAVMDGLFAVYVPDESSSSSSGTSTGNPAP